LQITFTFFCGPPKFSRWPPNHANYYIMKYLGVGCAKRLNRFTGRVPYCFIEAANDSELCSVLWSHLIVASLIYYIIWTAATQVEYASRDYIIWIMRDKVVLKMLYRTTERKIYIFQVYTYKIRNTIYLDELHNVL